MLPLEVFKHKRRWRDRGYQIELHSDFRTQGKEWCKRSVEQHRWHIHEWTDAFEDTYCFETKIDANNFRRYFRL